MTSGLPSPVTHRPRALLIHLPPPARFATVTPALGALMTRPTEIKRPSCTRTIRIHPPVSRHAVKTQEAR